MTKRMIVTMGAALALGLAGSAGAAPPARFLQDAVSGDNGEIAVGQLAQRRGGSDGVRDFGRTLEQDHAAAKAQALDVARTLHVRVRAAAVKPEAAQLRRRLMALSGPAFDREFRRAMIADHRKDIAKFEAQTHGPDHATAQLAEQTLPHLKHHLELAEALH